MSNGSDRCETTDQNTGMDPGPIRSCCMSGSDYPPVTITGSDYSKRLKEEQDHCHRLAMLKFKQYGREGDPFYTLAQIAARRDQNVPKTILDQLDKKMVSIASMVDKRKRVSEIRDAIVYLTMLNVYERGVRTNEDYAPLPPWACKDCG